MAFVSGQENQILGGAIGWQALIRGGGDVTSAQSRDAATFLSGATLGPGTYTYQIPVAGATAIDVHLRASAVTGTVAPSIAPTLSDGITAKTTATNFTDLVANTAQTVSITTLRGERFVLLTIAVGAGESVTFDRAEYSAL